MCSKSILTFVQLVHHLWHEKERAGQKQNTEEKYKIKRKHLCCMFQHIYCKLFVLYFADSFPNFHVSLAAISMSIR